MSHDIFQYLPIHETYREMIGLSTLEYIWIRTSSRLSRSSEVEVTVAFCIQQNGLEDLANPGTLHSERRSRE